MLYLVFLHVCSLAEILNVGVTELAQGSAAFSAYSEMSLV